MIIDGIVYYTVEESINAGLLLAFCFGFGLYGVLKFIENLFK